MAKYHAFWRANNSTSCGAEFSNKAKALKWARDCALANRFVGNNARWTVYDDDGNSVYEGIYMPNHGIHYRIKNYEVVDR